MVNEFLQQEASAYRFAAGMLAPITNEIEITEIDNAIVESSDAVSEQLHRALELMSDRQTPDYRNSVKESISAIEAQVRSTLGTEKGALGDLIKGFDRISPIHPAMGSAFSALYGYTSDESGIRHALIDGGRTVTFKEAKFMLVACSAFVNFVRSTDGK